MIPRTYPSQINPATGRREMIAFFLTSVTGLQRWTDYIPIKLNSAAAPGREDHYNADGFIAIASLSSITGLNRYKDYVPVYVDNSATDAWQVNSVGYIPYGLSGAGGASLSLNFAYRGATLDSRITFTRADAVTCATYFDSTGRLQTAAANVARFDYDPATPAGVTGGELVTNGGFDTSANWAITQPTSGTSSIGNGQLTLQTLDGTYTGATQNITASIGKRYRITVTCLSVSGSNPAFAIAASTSGSGSLNFSSAGTYSCDIYALSTTLIVELKRGGGATNGSVVLDNVSVQELVMTPRGLLIEESRQNLLLQSRDMTLTWTRADVTAARTQVGLDGAANTACLMTEGSTNGAITRQDGSAVTAGATVTASVVFKRGNTDWVRLSVRETTQTDGVNAWFNLSTGVKGVVSAVGAGTNNSSTITSLGGGWYRCTVTSTPNGTYTIPQILFMSASADSSTNRVSGATYIVDCAQLETGAFATSIIPTTTTALVRASDIPVMTGSNFSSWYNATQGSFVAEFRRFGFDGVAGSAVIAQADDGTSNNRVGLRLAPRSAAALAQQIVVVASVVNLNESLGPSTSIDGVTVKAAIGYQVGVGATGRSGTIVNATSNPSLPTVTQLNIGQGPSGTWLNGWLSSLRYYNTRLPNATLQSLTA